MRSSIDLIIYLLSLTIIVPLIVGGVNFLKFTLSMKFIYFYLLFSFFHEATEAFLKDPVSYNIQFYTYHLIFSVIYAIVFFYWFQVKKFNKYILLQTLFYVLSVFIEVSIIGLSTFRTSVAVLINQILYCFFAVILINRILSNKDSVADKRVKLLVLIPFFIFYTYMSILDIFMVFLFSPTTQKLFSNLYWVIRILNPINYLCVSLAFYLAPKKQIYLQ